jgi:hypothetical protein
MAASHRAWRTSDGRCGSVTKDAHAGWSLPGKGTMHRAMNRHTHRPPPETLILALMGAGLSRATAMAMEQWKAQEVLDLLHERALHGAGALRGGPRRRATLGTR